MIHLAGHGPQRVAPSLRVRPTSPASLAQRAARKNLSKGGQEALTEDVYKVTAEARPAVEPKWIGYIKDLI